jgi:hypothetical protein
MEQQSTPKSSPRDVFMYLFATGTLYFSALSIIFLLLSYVDILLPDPLKNLYGGPESAMRWFLAMLVVIFPAYLWAMRFIRHDIATDAAKVEIKVRRWLIYLTLFLSAILIIGDLVALIYNFLEGDLSTQFILKVVAVLAVGAAIFWYYHNDLRTKGAAFEPRVRNAVYGLIALVAAVAVTGFFLAGSPFRQRLVKFDDQKVSNLQNIQAQVVDYWRLKQALPQSLTALKDSLANYDFPTTDPQSDAAYEYRVTGERSFELCAEFNLSSEKDALTPRSVPGMSENWSHAAGRVCFERTIDPQLYPPYENTVKPAPVPAQ